MSTCPDTIFSPYPGLDVATKPTPKDAPNVANNKIIIMKIDNFFLYFFVRPI